MKIVACTKIYLGIMEMRLKEVPGRIMVLDISGVGPASLATDDIPPGTICQELSPSTQLADKVLHSMY